MQGDLSASLMALLPGDRSTDAVCVVSRRGGDGKFREIRRFPRWRKIWANTAPGEKPRLERIPAVVD